MPGGSRLPREQRRVQLIETAAHTFLERGFAGTSMDEVAQAAGVTRLIVYRIFDSKEELYRSVLRTVIDGLAVAFDGIPIDEVRDRGAATLILPVARANPDAFRLLWRHAWHEPAFEDVALEFRQYVTYYAREILTTYISGDEVLLDWAARSAGAHLVESLSNWLDMGDPGRDDELVERMTASLRSLAAAWAN